MRKHYQTPKIEVYEIELQDAVLVASNQEGASIAVPALEAGYTIGNI